MEPFDSKFDAKRGGAVGWHLIARGGDMTARVHPGMQLGVLPSGDLSFEAPNAVVQFDLAGEGLTLTVVADGYELELEAGERVRTLRVGAQTHVCLDFIGHTLDIDNDFAVASAPGDALTLYVVRRGEPRQALGPLSAPAHIEEADILVPERSTVTPLTAVPVDSLRREHAAAAADKRQAQAQRSNVRRVVMAFAASVLVVAGLVVTALYVASRSVEEAVTAPAGADVAAEPVPVETPEPAAAELPVPAADPEPQIAGESAQGVNQDVLLRLSALLESEPLPDKATIDFAVESLRSLMAAYPDDPRIPAALANLNERLVQEARQSYDAGDAFRAGRLIEQATALGLAAGSVEETLEYFASQPPGAAVAVNDPPPAAPDPAPATAEAAEPVVSEAAAEAMLIEALRQEEAANVAATDVSGSAAEPAAEDATGLDSLVETATGVALGALAVEVIVEDSAPVAAAPTAATDPVLASMGPAVPLTPADEVESRVQLALDNYLEESVAAAESAQAVSANELPDGFLAEEPSAGDAAATSAPATPAGPRFKPYSELVPVRQLPLDYPRRALEGAGGSIDVEFTVTETGRVIDVDVTGEAPAIFLRDTARTIRLWRFVPVRQNGEPIPVRTALRVTYRG